jgi:hypothetical protein
MFLCGSERLATGDDCDRWMKGTLTRSSFPNTSYPLVTIWLHCTVYVPLLKKKLARNRPCMCENLFNRSRDDQLTVPAMPLSQKTHPPCWSVAQSLNWRSNLKRVPAWLLAFSSSWSNWKQLHQRKGVLPASEWSIDQIDQIWGVYLIDLMSTSNRSDVFEIDLINLDGLDYLMTWYRVAKSSEDKDCSTTSHDPRLKAFATLDVVFTKLATTWFR